MTETIFEQLRNDIKIAILKDSSITQDFKNNIDIWLNNYFNQK